MTTSPLLRNVPARFSNTRRMWLLLPAVAACLVAGASAAVALPVPVAAWHVGLALAALALCAAARFRAGVVPAASVAALAAGLLCGSAALRPGTTALPDGAALVVVRVAQTRSATSDASIVGELVAWAPAGDRDQGVGQWRQPRGRLRVSVDGVATSRLPRCGDTVVVVATVEEPRTRLHEFAFDPAAWQRQRGLGASLRARGEVTAVRDSHGACAAIDELRLGMEEFLRAHCSPRTAGVLLALVTGSRGDLDADVRDRFSANGAAHVLAVSGLHLGLLCALAFAGVSRAVRVLPFVALRWGVRPAAAALTVPGVAAYVILTGAPASAVRAALMTVCVLVAIAVRRPASAIHGLSVAVIAMVGARPLAVADLGFQLSVAATLGLVLTVPRSASSDPSVQPGRLRRWLSSARRSIGVSVQTSVVASAATAPVLLWHFGSMPLAGALSNLVVVPPLALVALPAGFVGALAGHLGLPGAAGLVAVASGSVELATALAEGGARWLEPALIWGRPSVVGMAGWVLLAAVTPRWHSLSWRQRAAALAAVAALLVADFPRGWSPPRQTAFHAIPVGQGDCSLVELAGAERILIDGGGSLFGTRSVGATAVLPYLRGHGIGRLDVVIASHDDLDHVGGLADVVRATRPARVIVPMGARAGALAELRAAASEVGARWEPLWLPTASIAGTSRWVVLPSPLSAAGNDSSLVVRACDAQVCALFTGDVGAERERALVRAGVPLAATVLKVAHHGSSSASTEEFLRAVSPRVAVVHVGARNRYGHPSADVLARLRAVPTTVARTDGGSAVVVLTDGQRAWLTP
ncbi:MAG: DNA internalization-related competence protein ComEC/Rec2 [Myxococcales bacterium]|nr:DNA internalization-related competence protein ComEC/Rec2 [Myxococcales bacterium]